MNLIIDEVKANLFPASHYAIGDWTKFPWHRDRQQIIQAYKVESSQALAIDVFGAIKVSEDRDRILSALARQCQLPDAGPWKLELEWTDPENLLHEPRRTQVDAIAFGRNTMLVIECKFTEAGGGCSQPERISKGPHRGLRQCDGNYALQVNPANGVEARCALTGKGVLYWESIPKIFGLSSEQDYRPCPFRDESYQWMRNVVLANKLASARGVSSAVVAAYADADGFPTAQKARLGRLGYLAASAAPLVIPMSYQSIVQLAQTHSGHPGDWTALAAWVDKKIKTVTAKRTKDLVPAGSN